jgi:hypothetical protein
MLETRTITAFTKTFRHLGLGGSSIVTEKAKKACEVPVDPIYNGAAEDDHRV